MKVILNDTNPPCSNDINILKEVTKTVSKIKIILAWVFHSNCTKFYWDCFSSLKALWQLNEY